MQLYNTLTRKKEEFKSIKKTVGVYTCGPTVYWYAHIGNFRTFLFYDVLVRVLKVQGRKVKHVMNITDVGHLASDADEGEDKMVKAAKREKKTAWEVAKLYEQAFLEDSKLLNIEAVDVLSRATDHIPEQIKLIEKLEQRGHTYRTSDGIYFATDTFATYGKLSRQKLSEKAAGKRVAVGEKRSPADFALWKFSPKGATRDMEWDSPWGKGFPGWHIECSAMSKKYLGQPFDIHAGGIDHLPVHHENEIAQSEAAYQKPLANYWLHGEFLVVGKPGKAKRMGKSEGNIARVSELTDRYDVDPLSYRYLCFTTHYRKKLYFEVDALKAADQALRGMRRFVASLPKPSRSGLSEAETQFFSYVSNDLDLPRALAFAHKLMKKKNIDLSALHRTLLTFDKVFGFGLDRPIKAAAVPAHVVALVEKREQARREKDWAQADALRVEIKAAGYVLRDTPEGIKLEKQ